MKIHAPKQLQRLPLMIAAFIVVNAGCSGAKDFDSDTSLEQNGVSDTFESAKADGVNGADGDSGSQSGDDMSQAVVQYRGLVINEVAAKGDPHDWFELYNGSNQTIALDGLFISDDFTSEPKKAQLQGTISAGGYLVMMLDGVAYAGIGLGKEESLALVAENGDLIDLVSWQDGDSPDGSSWGRTSDGAADFQIWTPPTPGAPNTGTTPNDDAVCGDGIVQIGEVCDGESLNDKTCEALGFQEGVLTCVSDCSGYDTRDCTERTARVVINEITSKNDDEIEIYNAGSAPADLSGWSIADIDYPAQPDHVYVIEEGTILNAGEYMIFVKDKEHTFGLGDEDRVTLFNDTGAVMDEVSWSVEDDASVSWCRWPNGEGAWGECSSATFGEANQKP